MLPSLMIRIISRATWWKEIAEPYRWSSDFYTHLWHVHAPSATPTHTYTHTKNNKVAEMVSCLISENGEIVIQRNRGSEFNLLLLNIGKKKTKRALPTI